MCSQVKFHKREVRKLSAHPNEDLLHIIQIGKNINRKNQEVFFKWPKWWASLFLPSIIKFAWQPGLLKWAASWQVLASWACWASLSPHLLWLCPGGKHRKVQTAILQTHKAKRHDYNNDSPISGPTSKLSKVLYCGEHSHKSGFFCIRGLYNWWLHFKYKIVNTLGKSPYPFLVRHTCNL